MRKLSASIRPGSETDPARYAARTCPSETAPRRKRQIEHPKKFKMGTFLAFIKSFFPVPPLPPAGGAGQAEADTVGNHFNPGSLLFMPILSMNSRAQFTLPERICLSEGLRWLLTGGGAKNAPGLSPPNYLEIVYLGSSEH